MSDPKLSVVLPLLLPDKFTVALTEFCIRAMRLNAERPDDYELIVVETGSKYFDPMQGGPRDPMLRIDRYVSQLHKTTYVNDWNAGAEMAKAPYVVHMGNDVIAGQGWDSALLEPFEKYKDCGVTCTAATEPGAFIGPRLPVPIIVEGMFAPMMCFSQEWRLDTSYEGGYSDADLVMRIYTKGLRAYRNCRSQCHHLDRVTWSRAYPDRGERQMADGERIFYERWSNSPLMMYGLIRAGGWVYGREHESLLAGVKLRGQGN